MNPHALSPQLLKHYSRYYTALEPYIQNPHTRSYFTVSLTLFALTIFGWFAIQPTITTIVGLVKELHTVRQVNRDLEAKISALVKAQDTLAKEAENLAPLDEGFPVGPNLSYVVGEIEAAATLSQVTLASLQISRITFSQHQIISTGSLTEQPLSLSVSVQGDATQLTSFLDALASSRRIIHFGTISIGSGKTIGSGPISLSVTLNAPYLVTAEPTTESKPKTPIGPTEDVLKQPKGRVEQ